MGKLRSKLKRNSKGKTWGRGQSATSNPEQMKHRLKAKSRYFQPNIKLATENAEATPKGLTTDALMRHEMVQAYNHDNDDDDDMVSINGSLRSISLTNRDGDADEAMSQSQRDTMNTFKTFASNYSNCSNVSFKKLLHGFRINSDMHIKMLAILSALTEFIQESGGTESSTEYFVLLMKQIDASKSETDILAGIALLSLGIKAVPVPVLRKRFDATATTLLQLLQRFSESANHTTTKNLIGCLSVLLRAQAYLAWSYPSINQYIDVILSFTIHSKPKIRKAAQHAVVAIMNGSCFMLPPTPNPTATNEAELSEPKPVITPKFHPASSRLTKFCVYNLSGEAAADINSRTLMLHTVSLLKDTIACCSTEDIHTICEQLLTIMTAANVLLRTNCFKTIHALFQKRTENLTDKLCGKLLTALYEYRPDRSDINQSIAWLTVLKEGYIHLSKIDEMLCIALLPRIIEVCTTDLWYSNSTNLVGSVTTSIRELLQECLPNACSSLMRVERFRIPVTYIINLIEKVLNTSFDQLSATVIGTISILYEACGRNFSNELKPSLSTIAKRYDPQNKLRIPIEHAIISAIKSLGPEIVLEVIPLANKNGIILEQTWLLPLLREGCSGATFQFFKETILKLANDCYNAWHKHKIENTLNLSHTYELLACQLWGLFPGFCRQPTDPENLMLLGPTLGAALDNNPEFRAPIFDGLVELLQNGNPACHDILSKLAKNFMPRLFNIYTTKPNGTYEADMRDRALDVIGLYIVHTPTNVQLELFEILTNELKTQTLCSFGYDSIYHITTIILIHQTAEKIRNFYETYMVPVLKNEKSKLVSRDEQKLKKQQRMTYQLLHSIMDFGSASCQKFIRANVIALQKVLLDSFSTTCTVSHALRLGCLKILIQNNESLTCNDKLVIKTLPEAVLNYKELSTRKQNIAEELVILISDIYHMAGKLNDMVDILAVGFTGDEMLITNTILAFRGLVKHQQLNLTMKTIAFILEQVNVFLVQKSRHQAEASVAFIITFIKVLPTPFVNNHLKVIMHSLSAMTKDTKRYCRIQIGYLLKKLCKLFTPSDLASFVPGDDELTHRRLKKIRKEMRREARKDSVDAKENDDENSANEFEPTLEKKTVTIDDILADSDSDLPDDMEDDSKQRTAGKSNHKNRSTYIREDPEDIVDLADIKSIANVLTNRPDLSGTNSKSSKTTNKGVDANRGFKTAEDGRLIISDKALRGVGSSEEDDDDHDDDDSDNGIVEKSKLGMEDSSDEENQVEGPSTSNANRKPGGAASSVRSGASQYISGGKGIHRKLGPSASTDAVSMKSGYSAKSMKSAKSASQNGANYSTKKAKGDMKKRGKLDPYAYIPLTRNNLNKRKKSSNSRHFKKMFSGGGTQKSGKIGKKYRK